MHYIICLFLFGACPISIAVCSDPPLLHSILERSKESVTVRPLTQEAPGCSKPPPSPVKVTLAYRCRAQKSVLIFPGLSCSDCHHFGITSLGAWELISEIRGGEVPLRLEHVMQSHRIHQGCTFYRPKCRYENYVSVKNVYVPLDSSWTGMRIRSCISKSIVAGEFVVRGSANRPSPSIMRQFLTSSCSLPYYAY